MTVTKCIAHVPSEPLACRNVISHVAAIPLCHRTIARTTTSTAATASGAAAAANTATGTTNPSGNDADTRSNAKTTSNIGEYDTLTEYQAYDMIHKLSDSDRTSLSSALNKFDSEKIKSKLQGERCVGASRTAIYVHGQK